MADEDPPPSPPHERCEKSFQYQLIDKSTQKVSYLNVLRGISQPNPSPTVGQFNVVNPSAKIINSLSDLKPTSTHQGKPSISFKKWEKNQLIAKLNHILIAKFTHGRPSIAILKKFFVDLKLQGDYNFSVIDSKHVFLECLLFDDYVKFWLKGVWIIDGYPMRVFKWTEDFNPYLESPITPVWIHLPGLPLYFFDEEALVSIANVIGRPLKIDMNNINRIKLGCASICVEVDVSKPLMDGLWINLVEDDNTVVYESIWQKVVYGYVPPFCPCCNHLGHQGVFCKRQKGESNEQSIEFVGKESRSMNHASDVWASNKGNNIVTVFRPKMVETAAPKNKGKVDIDLVEEGSGLGDRLRPEIDIALVEERSGLGDRLQLEGADTSCLQSAAFTADVVSIPQLSGGAANPDRVTDVATAGNSVHGISAGGVSGYARDAGKRALAMQRDVVARHDGTSAAQSEEDPKSHNQHVSSVYAAMEKGTKQVEQMLIRKHLRCSHCVVELEKVQNKQVLGNETDRCTDAAEIVTEFCQLHRNWEVSQQFPGTDHTHVVEGLHHTLGAAGSLATISSTDRGQQMDTAETGLSAEAGPVLQQNSLQPGIVDDGLSSKMTMLQNETDGQEIHEVGRAMASVHITGAATKQAAGDVAKEGATTQTARHVEGNNVYKQLGNIVQNSGVFKTKHLSKEEVLVEDISLEEGELVEANTYSKGLILPQLDVGASSAGIGASVVSDAADVSAGAEKMQQEQFVPAIKGQGVHAFQQPAPGPSTIADHTIVLGLPAQTRTSANSWAILVEEEQEQRALRSVDFVTPLKQRDPAEKVENEVRIISSSSLSDIEVLAQQEMEKIWTTTNTDAHISNTYILDKVGSPVPCSEVIRTSPRLSKVRNYVDSVKNGNSIPALKDKEATMKDKKLYDTLRHKYNEEIRLTFEEHQQNIYATDYTTQKATTQNQEVIPDDAAVDKKEWTTVIRRSQRLNKKQGK